MKSATFGLCVLIVLCAGSAVRAQCNCGISYPAYTPHYPHYPQPAYPQSYHPMPAPMPTPMPVPPRPIPGTMGGSSVAYVNKLATPVPRANYTLNYAVHLTDGRILLSDFLPPGQTVRGIESQSGTGGRRLSTSNISGGAISVTDPTNNTTVATFAPAVN